MIKSQMALMLLAISGGRSLAALRFVVLVSVCGCVDSMTTVDTEGLGQLTNGKTST
jgi:hypothetical protein